MKLSDYETNLGALRELRAASGQPEPEPEPWRPGPSQVKKPKRQTAWAALAPKHYPTFGARPPKPRMSLSEYIAHCKKRNIPH